jgi:hypothetical protein
MSRIDPRFTVDRNLGKFLDFDTGKQVDAPAEDAPIVIVAGLWENMPKGAMQEKCKVCKRLVGVDPRSQKFLAQPGKVHILMCRDCWEGFELWRAQDWAGMSKWLDRMEQAKISVISLRRAAKPMQ